MKGVRMETHKMRDFCLSACSSNERCESGEYIQDVDIVFPLAVAVKISRLRYC